MYAVLYRYIYTKYHEEAKKCVKFIFLTILSFSNQLIQKVINLVKFTN